MYLTTISFCRLCATELFNASFFGEQNIPVDGPFIVAANHLSHLDPPLIGAAFRSRELFFLARKTLFKPGFWNFLLSHINTISVDKQNNAEIHAIRQALSLLKKGFGVVIFPEGTRSLDGNFGPAQAGVGFLACKTQVPVIPVRIEGTYEILRKNSVLPDLHKKSALSIGTPLLPEHYDVAPNSKQRYQLAADFILQQIRNIPAKLTPQIS